jgi:hypothetical protein
LELPETPNWIFAPRVSQLLWLFKEIVSQEIVIVDHRSAVRASSSQDAGLTVDHIEQLQERAKTGASHYLVELTVIQRREAGKKW